MLLISTYIINNMFRQMYIINIVYNMNLFIQIDVRIAILPRLSRPRWYIIVIFCGNLRNMPSRNTGKNNKNILWLLGSQILGNKTNCDQMTQKGPASASASASPIVGVFSARWLAAVWPGHTPAPGPRADINGGVSPVVTTPWAYLPPAYRQCQWKAWPIKIH